MISKYLASGEEDENFKPINVNDQAVSDSGAADISKIEVIMPDGQTIALSPGEAGLKNLDVVLDKGIPVAVQATYAQSMTTLLGFISITVIRKSD